MNVSYVSCDGTRWALVQGPRLATAFQGWVLHALAMHFDSDGIAYPSLTRLCQITRLEERSVRRVLRQLGVLGIVRQVQKAAPGRPARWQAADWDARRQRFTDNPDVRSTHPVTPPRSPDSEGCYRTGTADSEGCYQAETADSEGCYEDATSVSDAAFWPPPDSSVRAAATTGRDSRNNLDAEGAGACSQSPPRRTLRHPAADSEDTLRVHSEDSRKTPLDRAETNDSATYQFNSVPLLVNGENFETRPGWSRADVCPPAAPSDGTSIFFEGQQEPAGGLPPLEPWPEDFECDPEWPAGYWDPPIPAQATPRPQLQPPAAAPLEPPLEPRKPPPRIAPELPGIPPAPRPVRVRPHQDEPAGPTPREMFDLWNRLTKGSVLPCVVSFSAAREKGLRAVRSAPCENNLAKWEYLIDGLLHCPDPAVAFYRGGSPSGWIADLDWLLKSDNADTVLGKIKAWSVRKGRWPFDPPAESSPGQPSAPEVAPPERPGGPVVLGPEVMTFPFPNGKGSFTLTRAERRERGIWDPDSYVGKQQIDLIAKCREMGGDRYLRSIGLVVG